MATIRGTTPTFTITLSGINLSEGYHVFVTIDQNGLQLTKSNTDDSMVLLSDVNEDGETVTTINLSLTQEETLLFKVGGADVQLKWIDKTGNVSASDIGEVSFNRALLGDVIEL